MELPEERTLGGEREAGQDVTIILVPKGGSADQKLALVHLHSHVLATHSSYFSTCLSERWKQPASPASSIEFVLEVHTDAEIYFDCFSNMYPPPVKTFQGVKHGVELLKVASQIDYPELMERISLYLSTMLWSEEDEIRVREYSSSPDFPRIHLKDLVARLGLDVSEEHRQKQLCDLIRQWIRAALYGTDIESYRPRAFFTECLQGFGHGSLSNLAKIVVTTVIREAEDMFVNIAKDWSGDDRNLSDADIRTTLDRVDAMIWILKALLQVHMAEDLVRGFVHIHVIPDRISIGLRYTENIIKYKFGEAVLVMYQEVVAGRLLLRSPERMALLVNWQSIMKRTMSAERVEVATEELFSTLSLKEQLEVISSRKENFGYYFNRSSLFSMLSTRSWSGRELDLIAVESEAVETATYSRFQKRLKSETQLN